MSNCDGEFMATRITAVRVLMTRDGSDDLVLRITATDREQNFLVSRTEFFRLVRSLSDDAAKLLLMAAPAEAVQ